MIVNNNQYKNTIPLCFMPDGKLVCYQHGDILVLECDQVHFRYRLFKSIKDQICARFKLFSRLFRLGIRAAEAIDNEHIVFFIGKTLYELNVSSGKLSKGYFCGDSGRPLIFTTIKSIEGFRDGVFFGGYSVNGDKKPVNVYRRTGVDQWEVVYTFPEGTINHVHTIIPDSYRQCLWIFTGDYNDSAAIWKVTDDFTKVERVVCNNQMYRACVAFALPEGLLYATDAPFTSDSINLLNTESLNVKELFSIHGSCIYGCKWNNQYVFSSTVEGDGRNLSLYDLLFSRKRGVGIKDNYVHMYCGSVKDGFMEIYKEKKDWLPLYSFQFGVFKFPYGENLTDRLYFQPIATEDNDLNLIYYKS